MSSSGAGEGGGDRRDDPRTSDPSQIHVYQAADSPDPTADALGVLAVAFSLIAFFMKTKYMAWMAVFSAIMSFANTRNIGERQNFTSLMVPFTMLAMTYFQPVPTKSSA